MICPTAVSMNDLNDKIIKRDIEYIIEKTKVDSDELEYNFEQFKRALSLKITLYISENFERK